MPTATVREVLFPETERRRLAVCLRRLLPHVARERVALLLLQFGAIAIVLAALPYKTFDLDRFFVPKELVLYAVSAVAALLCLGGRRRVEMTRVDLLLAAFLCLSAVSALFAHNWWIAGRSLMGGPSGHHSCR